MTIGEVIRNLRMARGWKQQTLAEHSGLAQAFISQVERGHRSNLTMDVLRRFAAAFEMPLAELLRAAGENVPAPDELATLLSELDLLGVAPMTIAAYRQMGDKLTEPADREAVLVAVRSLRDTIHQQQAPIKSRRHEHPVASNTASEANDSPPANDRISARGRVRRAQV